MALFSGHSLAFLIGANKAVVRHPKSDTLWLSLHKSAVHETASIMGLSDRVLHRSKEN